jgi:D-galactarolactone cycloisomerase
MRKEGEMREWRDSVGGIRVTRVRIHNLQQVLQTPISWCAGSDVASLRTTVVEVETNAGITGWGEGRWGEAIVRQAPGLVIGRSPFEIESIFDQIGGQRGARAPGGLDVALWDVIGKALARPVSDLLGQVHRRRVQPYASVGYRKNSWPDLVDGFAQDARYWTQEQGFRAIKIKTGYGPELDIKIVRAVRQAIGPDIKLGIDSGHPGAYDDGTAVGLGRQLEEFNLEFWEEPIDQADLAGYARLKNALRIPLASGETATIDWLIANLLNRQAVDIVQPDVVCVGLTGGRRIGYACWLNRVRLIPHTWSHTPIRIAATLHWMCTLPTFFDRIVDPPPCLMELHPPYESVAWDLTEECLDPSDDDGLIPVPTGAGLGLTIRRDVLDKHRVGDVIEIA